MAKYLDASGVKVLWDRIGSVFAKKADVRAEVETLNMKADAAAEQCDRARDAAEGLKPIVGDRLPMASERNHTRFAIVNGETERLFINLKYGGRFTWFELKQSGVPIEDGAVLGAGRIGAMILEKAG